MIQDIQHKIRIAFSDERNKVYPYIAVFIVVFFTEKIIWAVVIFNGFTL